MVVATAAVLVRVIVVMTVTVIVIMSMFVLAARGFARAERGEIVKAHDDHADATPQHHGTEDTVRRKVARDPAADVEVEHDTAPQQEKQRAGEMDAEALGLHGGLRFGRWCYSF